MLFKLKMLRLAPLVTLGGIMLVGLSFQNCAPSFEALQSESSLNLASVGDTTCDGLGVCRASTVAAPTACRFDGKKIAEGQSVTAFLESSSSSCASETRICRSGVLTGSYQYASCAPGSARACLFDGQSLQSGTSVTAYQAVSDGQGGTRCESESRICNDGSLSGSFPFASCTAEAAKQPCLFDGLTIGHNEAVVAFQNSSVPSGQSCTNETRLCMNGKLSGSYAYSSCAVAKPKSCLFNGQTVAHNQSVVANLSASVPVGASCIKESRICNDGVLSGSYTYATCDVAVPSACTFDGRSIPHGGSVQAFPKSSVNYGGTCVAEQRTCDNGVLSGSAAYASCQVAVPNSCMFNGQTVAHGQSTTAFQNSSVAYGANCVSQTRLCSDGLLSGTYNFASCSVATPASCLFNGQTIAHGASVNAFLNSSVAANATCQTQSRVCSNGTLSGNYSFASCTVAAPASCLFNGQTIAHGASVNAFQASSVPSNASCQVQVRTCTNGALSGSFSFASCQANAPASCLFNGRTIAHGQSTSAYANITTAAGTHCTTETRVCQNGTLSGSFTLPNCSTTPCAFGGRSFAPGEEIIAYNQSSVQKPEKCQPKKFVCSLGSLPYDYRFASCEEVEKGRTCEADGINYAHGSTHIFSQHPFQMTPGDSSSCGFQTPFLCQHGVWVGTGGMVSSHPSTNHHRVCKAISVTKVGAACGSLPHGKTLYSVREYNVTILGKSRVACTLGAVAQCQHGEISLSSSTHTFRDCSDPLNKSVTYNADGTATAVENPLANSFLLTDSMVGAIPTPTLRGLSYRLVQETGNNNILKKMWKFVLAEPAYFVDTSNDKVHCYTSAQKNATVPGPTCASAYARTGSTQVMLKSENIFIDASGKHVNTINQTFNRKIAAQVYSPCTIAGKTYEYHQRFLFDHAPIPVREDGKDYTYRISATCYGSDRLNASYVKTTGTNTIVVGTANHAALNIGPVPKQQDFSCFNPQQSGFMRIGETIRIRIKYTSSTNQNANSSKNGKCEVVDAVCDYPGTYPLINGLPMELHLRMTSKVNGRVIAISQSKMIPHTIDTENLTCP